MTLTQTLYYSAEYLTYARTFLTPQAVLVLAHMEHTGSITQREALLDHSVQSLTRRITELNHHGFRVNREDKKHPLTGQRYARYSLA